MTFQCESVGEGEDGWSEWIHPLPGYLMQCCDCGLIHQMDFAIGYPSDEKGPLNKGETRRRVIIFRARRYKPSENDTFSDQEKNRPALKMDDTFDPCI